MNFVQRPNIDCEKWDSLVARTSNAGIYNKSFFLDALADNWCIYVDQDYSRGIAIPFTQKLKYKIVYTPNFLRSVNFLGAINQSFAIEILNKIKNEFQVGELSIENTEFTIEGENRVFQRIDFFDSHNVNTQSKRMLKKFTQSDFSITNQVNLDKINEFLETNLFQRLEGLNKSDLLVFRKLMNKLEEHKLLFKYAVYNSKNELKGCALFMQTDDKLTYIKGVATNDAMKEGAMYALLNYSINLAKENNLVFDFGGSNIDSVKQFYTNLGGRDVTYYRTKWGKLPVYYQIAKYIYHYFGKIK